MSRKKTSIIWTTELETLKKVVKNSISISEILRYFNFENKGSNYRTLKQRLNQEDIDYSHIKLGQGSNKGRTFPSILKRLSEDIFIENSTYNDGTNLKKRLFKEELIEQKCSECGLGTNWNNKFICLQLDHINGIHNDNRLENLRILCPNCHSQTETFAGKRFNYKLQDKLKSGKDSCSCGKEKYKISLVCQNCRSLQKRKVIDRPTKEVLFKQVWEMPSVKVAKIYGVTDKTIEKWCKIYRISKPQVGYWRKLETNKLLGDRQIGKVPGL